MTPPKKRHRLTIWHGRTRVFAAALTSAQRHLVREVLRLVHRGDLVGDDIRQWDINADGYKGTIVLEELD